MKRVFVSYSRRNKNFAERVARDLSDAGLDVWVDWRQIQAGELWQNEIYRGIERSEMLVVCLSPDAVNSEWVQREVNAAREQGKFIIPVMAVNAYAEMQRTEALRWLLDVHFINFENRYEEAFPELLQALPGKRRVSAYDDIDPENIPDPFKGLEAFQQTDAHFFFGREELIRKCLKRLQQNQTRRFLAVVGGSGSGKSSLVRAGVIPEIRAGTLPSSDGWPVLIFTPGETPVDALAQRLSPLMEDMEMEGALAVLRASPGGLDQLTERILAGDDEKARLLIIVDQFEEVFTRAGDIERDAFLRMLVSATTRPGGRTLAIITMRADFFDRLGRYPDLAVLFEQENMVIVTEMTPADLLRSIEGPAEAVGLIYDDGLPQRILDDVRRQPGSLPLLQYALKQLYQKREGRRLTNASYEAIGGVRRALARHAEEIYDGLNPTQQSIMRRVMLSLIEVGETGEATRRRVNRNDLQFRDVPQQSVEDLIDLLTAANSRLLMTSRQIRASDDQSQPVIWVEVSHEALIREWDRFTSWVAENVESLRYGTELLQAANDWHTGRRDVAYLLTGNRLMRAQVWIQVADPTPLQKEYIQASLEEHERRELARQAQAERELTLQKRSNKLLRAFVLVLVLSLIVALGLSLFAFNNLNIAETQTQRANSALTLAADALRTSEENAQEALSLALSASANRALGDNETDLAVMLAVAANQISDPPSQAQRTLAEVAYAPGTRRIFSEHGGTPNTVVLSPDGSLALSASDRVPLLWDPDTAALIRALDGTSAHNRIVTAAALSLDSRTAATADDSGAILLWDVSTTTATRALTGHLARVNGVVFSPDGTRLASGDSDGVFILWDVAEARAVLVITGHTGSVNAIAFSADGMRVATASEDGTVRVWDGSTGAPIGETLAVGSPVNAVVFTARLNIVTGSDDGLVRLWNFERAEVTTPFNVHDSLPVNALAINAAGEVVVSGGDDNRAVMIDLITSEVTNIFNGHSGPVRAVAMSGDARRVLTAAADGTIRVWDSTRAEQIQRYVGHRSNIRSRTVVGVFGPGELTILSGSADGTMRLWNTLNTLTVQEFALAGQTSSTRAATVNAVALSADGTRALSGDSNDEIILWDVASGQIIRTMTGHTGDVQAVTFLPDQRRAISAGADSALILWDLETGEALRQYGPQGPNSDGHNKVIFDLALNPDGSVFASASGDERILLWDVATGEIVREILDQKEAVRSIAFSPDGLSLLTSGVSGRVYLWNVADGTLIRRFEGHTSTVFDVAFSPDGRFIATGGRDFTLRLWDIASGLEIRRFQTDEAVRSVAFSADGRQVVTGLDDSSLRTWRALTELRDLVDWTFANRFVAVPTCEQIELFRLGRPCGEDGIAPVPTPYPLPTPTPIPAAARFLTIGHPATVNTDRGENLRIRWQPSTASDIIVSVPDGTIVTLIGGPVEAEGFRWWNVRTEDGTEGWAVDSVPQDGVQTLIP